MAVKGRLKPCHSPRDRSVGVGSFSKALTPHQWLQKGHLPCNSFVKIKPFVHSGYFHRSCLRNAKLGGLPAA